MRIGKEGGPGVCEMLNPCKTETTPGRYGSISIYNSVYYYTVISKPFDKILSNDEHKKSRPIWAAMIEVKKFQI